MKQNNYLEKVEERIRIKVDDIPLEFLDYLHKILKDVKYGKVEISIVAGCINVVHVTKQDKLVLEIDRDGNESISLDTN